MALEERKRDARDVASLPGDVVRLIKEHVIESAIDSEPRVGLMLEFVVRACEDRPGDDQISFDLHVTVANSVCCRYA